MRKFSDFTVLHLINADRDMLHCQNGSSRRQSRYLNVICAVSLLFFCFSVDRVHGDLAADAIGLTNFKQGVDGLNVLAWNATDVCQWEGIECMVVGSQSTRRVAKIRLPKNSLSGVIPPNSLSQITELRVVSLRSNLLSGTVPPDLKNCGFLRSIYLQNNKLSGPLPSNFSVWPNLIHVDFSFNNITGSMPESLADLRQIKSLYLQNNSLTGSIPALNMSSLTNFNVSYNHFSGSIPAAYRNFSPSAFLGNDLCGSPLSACTTVPAVQAAAPVTAETPEGKDKLSGGAIAGIVIGGVIFLTILFLFCCFAYKRKKSDGAAKKQNPYEARSFDGNGMAEGDQVHKSEALPGGAATAASSSEPRLIFFEGKKYSFTLEELLRASAEVLGKGSVGTSYKAIMESGTIVAVKRLKDVSLEKKDFEMKMEYFAKLKHENLVPFIAYYYSREEKLLVSNYMTNGSLSAQLHGNKEANRTPLDWDTRVRIALGAALGINRLHKDDFTHGNIKSSNILLTSNYTGCVSDYGLTQLVSASSAASRMVGYRAPEVTDFRKTTPKTDVYSFGVLLLEILTGKPPSHTSTSDEGLDLPRWVQSVPRDEADWISKVFDPQLTRFEGSEGEMEHVLDIALECVKHSPDQRPTMKQLVERLENYKAI